MPDYQEMYLKMARTVARVIDELIQVERECKEMYISSGGIGQYRTEKSAIYRQV